MTYLERPGRHPATNHLLSTFAFEHLPLHQQAVSGPCAELADYLTGELEDGPELTAGLRKLREASECFVLQAAIDWGRRVERDERARILARLAGTPDIPDAPGDDEPGRGAAVGQPVGEG